MILTTPLRFITRQLLHLGLTDADTFMINAFYLFRPVVSNSLFEPISNATSSQVVWGQFYQDSVAGKDADEVHPNLSGNVSQHFVVVWKFNAEHPVRQRFFNASLDLNRLFFRHKSSSRTDFRPSGLNTESSCA
tara:strand:- start:180 stop:581 length:402 start_codon:yes stop_codon:yes gene_type:complete